MIRYRRVICAGRRVYDAGSPVRPLSSSFVIGDVVEGRGRRCEDDHDHGHHHHHRQRQHHHRHGRTQRGRDAVAGGRSRKASRTGTRVIRRYGGLQFHSPFSPLRRATGDGSPPPRSPFPWPITRRPNPGPTACVIRPSPVCPRRRSWEIYQTDASSFEVMRPVRQRRFEQLHFTGAD